MPLRGQLGCKISFGRRLARKLLDEAMPEVCAADSRARKSVTSAGARDGSGLHRDARASILLSRLSVMAALAWRLSRSRLAASDAASLRCRPRASGGESAIEPQIRSGTRGSQDVLVKCPLKAASAAAVTIPVRSFPSERPMRKWLGELNRL